VGDAARFLVVDDDPLVGRNLARILRPFGEAIVAGTVSGAKALLASHVSWQGLFIDMGLPDGSGLEVLGAARAAFPDVRAMVLTGSTEPELINAVHDLGAHYVVKPVDGSRIERFCRGIGREHEPQGERTAASEAAGTQGTPETLDGCIARLRKLLLLRLDPLVRYSVGAVIAQIKANHGVYGKNAVSVVAAALREDPPSLYRHAAVAEVWTEAEVRELLTRKGRDGRSLSWSHIVLLGSVTPAETRADLVEVALAEGLSVRELSAQIPEQARGTR
jgi:ActR/RegA family two-component response regulator